MLRFRKRKIRQTNRDYSCYFKITVFFSQMAPADDMPAEGIKNQAYRFGFTQTRFTFVIFVFNFYKEFGRKGLLQDGQTREAWPHTIGQSHADVAA